MIIFDESELPETAIDCVEEAVPAQVLKAEIDPVVEILVQPLPVKPSQDKKG